MRPVLRGVFRSLSSSQYLTLPGMPGPLGCCHGLWAAGWVVVLVLYFCQVLLWILIMYIAVHCSHGLAYCVLLHHPLSHVCHGTSLDFFCIAAPPVPPFLCGCAPSPSYLTVCTPSPSITSIYVRPATLSSICVRPPTLHLAMRKCSKVADDELRTHAVAAAALLAHAMSKPHP